MERAKKRYRLSFTPHAIRHLFVTQHLVWINEEAADDQQEQQRLKAGLVQIMGWHSRETMQIYDHTFSVQEAVHTLHEFQREAEIEHRWHYRSHVSWSFQHPPGDDHDHRGC